MVRVALFAASAHKHKQVVYVVRRLYVVVAASVLSDEQFGQVALVVVRATFVAFPLLQAARPFI